MDEEFDPFSPQNLPIVQLIVSMRIYDALMALLQQENPGAAKDLLELHLKGTMVGPMARLNGTFIADELNLVESPEDEMNYQSEELEELGESGDS